MECIYNENGEVIGVVIIEDLTTYYYSQIVVEGEENIEVEESS